MRSEQAAESKITLTNAQFASYGHPIAMKNPFFEKINLGNETIITNSPKKVFLLMLCAILFTMTSACLDVEPTLDQANPLVFKLEVSEAGVYRVTDEMLHIAGATTQTIDPQDYKLFQRGIEQPLWVLGNQEDFELLFLGSDSESAYSPHNTYLLTSTDKDGWWVDDQGGGDSNNTFLNSYGEKYPVLQLPSNAYAHQIILEENLLYLPQVEADEHWYWDMLPAPSSKEYPFNIDHLPENMVSEQNGYFRIAVNGSTEAGNVNPDHHLEVNINGQVVVDEWWDGIGRKIVEGSFPANLLRNGENSLTISSPGVTGVAADIYHLDWIEIYQPRTLQALGDQLFFIAPNDNAVLSGFSEPIEIFELEGNGSIRQMDESEIRKVSGNDTVAIATTPGNGYYVAGQTGIQSPDTVKLLDGSEELQTINGAEYVVIGPPDLIEAWQPIMELREEQGLSVVSIPLQGIYNQYNYSIAEPHAIQQLLRDAQSNWAILPRYLVLLGDSTYDPQGYISSPEANRLPVFLVDTIFGGQTVSDVDFVQLDDDQWPDLPIGLIPARTPEQVTGLADKILAYERDLDEYNNLSVVAIADGQEAHFAREGEQFLALFPENFQGELFTPPAGSEDAPQIIKGFFEGRNFLVAYFGHGSVNMWGKDRLFSAEQVVNLEQPNNYPIVVNMTCLTGLYTHPTVESLAEALLWQDGGGAVAILAPSSLTLPADQGKLSAALINEWLSNPEARVGDIHMLARQEVPVDRESSLDVMRTFMLFGDPALTLPNLQ